MRQQITTKAFHDSYTLFELHSNQVTCVLGPEQTGKDKTTTKEARQHPRTSFFLNQGICTGHQRRGIKAAPLDYKVGLPSCSVIYFDFKQSVGTWF